MAARRSTIQHARLALIQPPLSRSHQREAADLGKREFAFKPEERGEKQLLAQLARDAGICGLWQEETPSPRRAFDFQLLDPHPTNTMADFGKEKDPEIEGAGGDDEDNGPAPVSWRSAPCSASFAMALRLFPSVFPLILLPSAPRAVSFLLFHLSISVPLALLLRRRKSRRRLSLQSCNWRPWRSRPTRRTKLLSTSSKLLLLSGPFPPSFFLSSPILFFPRLAPPHA